MTSFTRWIALTLCGASGPETQTAIDAILAERGEQDFAAHFLADAGHAWAASLLANFPVQPPEGD